MSLKLNSSGGGSVLLQEPNTASNRTLTLPDADGTVIYSDASANLQFNSGYGSIATAYGCRAWVNFNGTGTVAIRASGNVSSITDNGTGDYTVNFTNAMPDANYSFGAICSSTAGASGWVARINSSGHVTSGSLRLTIVDPTVAIADALIIGVIVIR
jgi:uncharacterized protein (AIM24 family)